MNSERCWADENEVQQTIAAFLAEAHDGSADSAAMTAMLIHRYPEAAREAGVLTMYQALLLQSLQSKDPELLACLAEELIKGKRLATDAATAQRAASKSNDISGFMGAYVIGVLCAKSKPDFAISQFRKGRQVGHIPSMFFEHQLRSKRIPVVGVITKWGYRLFDMFVFWRAATSKDMRRLWRGADMFRTKSHFLSFLGPDRQTPFSRIDSLVPVTAKSNETPGPTDDEAADRLNTV
jgi:hypothetical protein